MRDIRPSMLFSCCVFLAGLVACGHEGNASGTQDAAAAPDTAGPTAAPAPAPAPDSAPLVENPPLVKPLPNPALDNLRNPASALAVAFTVPRVAAVGVLSSRSMIAEAVYFATAQTGAAMLGQVTKTGTIKVTQLGAQYLPTPADKLIVHLGDKVHEFEAIDAVGDPAAESAGTWLMSPHRLTYKHRMPGEAEATIQEQFDGQSFQAHVKGWAMLQGQRYEIDLTARGATQGSSDFDGRESKTRYELTGTVKGNGVEVDVREQHTSNFASSTSLRLLTTQRGSATQLLSTVASTVRTGGEEFRFQDVQVETGSKEKGGQASSGVVATSGAILRNGQPFAACTLKDGAPVAVAAGGTVVQLSAPGG